MLTPQEPFKWGCHTRVDKYEDDAAALAKRPYDVIEVSGNALLYGGAGGGGLGRLFTLLIGGGGSAYSASLARIGVGDTGTSPSPAASASDLQAAINAANRYWRPMVGGYPQIVTGPPPTLQFQASFGASDANFAWAEWGIDLGQNAGSNAAQTMLNRKVDALGTKANGSTWVITVTLSIA